MALRWECLPEASVPHGEPGRAQPGPQEAPGTPAHLASVWRVPGHGSVQLAVHAPLAILVLGSKEPQREDCDGEGTVRAVSVVPCDLSRHGGPWPPSPPAPSLEVGWLCP